MISRTVYAIYAMQFIASTGHPCGSPVSSIPLVPKFHLRNATSAGGG